MLVSDQRSYYRAALAGLRFVEQRTPTTRRFGADADARWRAFQGDLTTADRIDLMLRDADAQWPGAFGARTVFDLHGTAEDEAFGANWSPLDPVDAEELWRALPSPLGIEGALSAAADAWGLTLSTFDVGPVNASDQLVVAGPSAIAACIRTFASTPALDWADQVVCVASSPAHRQLAALGAALLNSTKPTVFGPGKGRRALVSDDAAPADLEGARC